MNRTIDKNTQNNIVRIAYACNDKFVLGLCVSAKSVLENFSKEKFLEIYILYNEENLNKANIESITKILASSRCKVIFVTVNIQKYNTFYIHNNVWSVEIFYRMSISELLPNVDKIIYLDSDTVVLSDISELYNTDINQYSVAAVQDPMIAEQIKEFCKHMNMKEYFNSGVLLLNLKEFREKNIFERFKEFAKKNEDITFYPDQDIMNAVLRGKVKFVGSEWNTMQITWDYIDAKKNNVKILHFTLTPKPWNYGYNCKNIRYFLKYFYKLPLMFRMNKYYLPNIKEFVKIMRKKVIWYRKSQKSLIFFNKITIRLFK